jgi:hypothetical protein
MRVMKMTSDHLLYYEKVFSKKTECLFIAFTILFSALFIWRVTTNSFDVMARILLFFSGFFLFYSLNFRTLIIRLTPEVLKLSFGIFTWSVPLNNVSECLPDDDLPVLMKYGGAGIHFMVIRKRYRASFNFLEHSRVVIRFKKKTGLVRDISFSTCHPDELIRCIEKAISTLESA